MQTQYGQTIANRLNGVISKQPVKNAGHVDGKPENPPTIRKAAAKGKTFKQKGNPNKSYSVDVIDKAVAKMGGH